jgi:DNA-binding NtrC family response regulator
MKSGKGMSMKRILIVDDDVTILSESRKLVQDRGVTVDVARTMEEAATLMEIREYECVIVGLRSAYGLGARELEVLRQIKENNGTTGIILLTGRGGPEATEEALSVGASYYYEKRLSAKVLQDVLKNWVGDAQPAH